MSQGEKLGGIYLYGDGEGVVQKGKRMRGNGELRTKGKLSGGREEGVGTIFIDGWKKGKKGGRSAAPMHIQFD